MKESPCSNATLQLDTLGGKINEMEPNHTAFPHRTNTLTYQFITYFDYDCHEYLMVPWLDKFYENMTEYMSKGCYRNYANPDLENYNHHYFLENYHKLVEIKKKYDSLNVYIPLFLKVEKVLLRLLPYIAVIVLLTITVLLLLRHFLCRDRGHTHRRKKQS